MKWVKKGLIFKSDNNYEWMASHTQLPIVDKMNDDTLRIYFGTRDKSNRTVTTYIEVLSNNPRTIVYLHKKPLLGLGELGCFDDSGAMPSWLVTREGIKYLYYIGWNVKRSVPYHQSIGLAMSEDGGQTYKRYSKGPICDRDTDEPFFCTAPCVLADVKNWKMWYVSCTGWAMINGQPEPYYNVKYAESFDGIHWRKTGSVCIDYDHVTDAISRPNVLIEKGTYKMFYSYRGIKDYRTNPNQSYRLGYAESQDGINWLRKDDLVGLYRSESGWDSEMIAYPYIYEHRGVKYMVYNGNSFGRSGFGYAILEEE